MRRIICVGNRWVERDAAGPRVYERLAARPCPPGVELVDGGIGGLELLPLVDGAERVVFVDSVAGYGAPGEVVVLDGPTAAEGGRATYGHGAGLGYLLRVLPRVCEGPPPEVVVVGIEPPADEGSIDRAAGEAWRAVGARETAG